MAFALVAVISWIGLRGGHGTVAAAAGRPAAAEQAAATEQADTAAKVENAEKDEKADATH